MAQTDENLNSYPDRIAELFVNKTILVTGGTGFVGKVFIEKLLRTCPDIRKIYIFIRTKKDKLAKARLKEMFDGPLFDLLKKKNSDKVFAKVEAISANIETADLELSIEDRKKLSEEVELIYHCAATIRFDEELQRAVFLNTRGTKLMLELAKECKKLMVFAYLSTAYCHLHERVLYEKAYPPPANPYTVIKTCEWINKDALNKITSSVLGNIPNTYAFTKALAEDLVNDEMDNLPVIILRPSVIIPVWKEPLPGWVDNINGPMGLLIAAGKGVLRTMYVKGEAYSDYVPVDIIANSMLCSTFFYSTLKKRFFNLTTSSHYKISFEEIIKIGTHVIENKIPFNGVLWYPGGGMRRWRWVHKLEYLLFQWIPAVFLDGLLILLRYEPVLMKVQKRIAKGYEVFEYYTNNQWDFYNEDSLEVVKTLNPKEKNTYKLDGNGIDYYEYFTNCIYSARLHILKESPDTIPAAKRHMKMLWFLDRLCKTLFFIGLIYLIYEYVFKSFFNK